MNCNSDLTGFHIFFALSYIYKILGVGLAHGNEYASLYCSLDSVDEKHHTYGSMALRVNCLISSSVEM